jgi:hypothetical protein
MRRVTIQTLNQDRTGWILWSGLFGVLAVWIAIGNPHSVTPAYHEAALHWIGGRNLYLDTGRGFLYLPQAALLDIPFALAPPVVSEIGWRIVTIGVFAAGAWRLSRLFGQASGNSFFSLATVLALPLSASAARNGQATLPIAGLMMLAAVDLSRRRWNRATFLLCLGFAFKPLTLVFILLAGGVYRPMALRLIGGLLIVLAAPYCTQTPDYVTSQYVDCLAMLRTAANVGLERPWAHFFGMVQAAGFEVDESIQTVVRFLVALGTLLLARRAVHQLPPERSAVYLYGLAGCYLMLFNPRTENNTYALVSPIIGLVWAESVLARRNWLVVVLLALMALGIVGSYELGRRLVPEARPVWLAPLMCLTFATFLVVRLVAEIRRCSEPAVAAEVSAATLSRCEPAPG